MSLDARSGYHPIHTSQTPNRVQSETPDHWFDQNAQSEQDQTSNYTIVNSIDLDRHLTVVRICDNRFDEYRICQFRSETWFDRRRSIRSPLRLLWSTTISRLIVRDKPLRFHESISVTSISTDLENAKLVHFHHQLRSTLVHLQRPRSRWFHRRSVLCSVPSSLTIESRY